MESLIELIVKWTAKVQHFLTYFCSMVCTVNEYEFIELSKVLPVIDARSPGEFEQGHIPTAINIPLFDNKEREQIGIIHNKSGRDLAIMKGLDIVLDKASDYVDRIKSLISEKRILIHCWRGGMRSASMAQIFNATGYEVSILKGGYKSYRRYIRSQFLNKALVVVLGGYTGSGKTKLLEGIARNGEQIIDLEKLACHKGSVFGSLGQTLQPTNEQFENNLYAIWGELDLSRPIWIEDESRMIGNVTIPDPLIDQISSGILVKVEVPISMRIDRLVQEYSCFDNTKLAEAVLRLRHRIGGARTREALQALDEHRYDIVAGIVLSHYDKAYQFAIERRMNKTIYKIELDQSNIESNASKIITFFYDIYLK